ncbi:hypothetical protein GOBAR_DD34437 [Gossypium barbadense]|nr:hypothetical protein GOBAR_DD34437 [Gossypium barbadense]
MELIDNEDVETMVALYCRNQSGHTEPIQLFAELVDMEPAKDFTPLSEEHRVQDLCTKVSRAFIDRRSIVEDYSDPDLDEVLDDIDDEGANGNGNVYASSVGNSSRGIVIHNDPEVYMLIVGLDTMHAS